uniref:Phosphatidylinositol 4-kinase type 2 n=1 Tax=Caenorhabditis japonica TaxID=281687 RepID=A0A8R1DKE0_CAEJA
MLCFCCFGRACLIPNTGYLSEAAASIVSEMLQLDVVPTTRIVKLASPSFFYSRFFGHYDVRPKEGSFQLYVNGYESGNTVFARWNYDKNLLNEEEEAKFQLLFQKMCIVDYVIRNTDRHMDNLLVRHVPGYEINLAAIDNGLAFPVRHPECTSRFRTYPFRWSNFPWAQAEFDPALRQHVLSLLTPHFVHRLCADLKKLFRHGIASSNYMLVNSQLRVVRGQIWNLRQALLANESPSEMAQRQPVVVCRSSDIVMQSPRQPRGMIGLWSNLPHENNCVDECEHRKAFNDSGANKKDTENSADFE